MAKINLEIDIKENDIDIAFGNQEDVDLDFGYEAVYTGSYELLPTVDGYTVETANKRMLRDIKVKNIAVSVVENAQGGNTITIA